MGWLEDLWNAFSGGITNTVGAIGQLPGTILGGVGNIVAGAGTGVGGWLSDPNNINLAAQGTAAYFTGGASGLGGILGGLTGSSGPPGGVGVNAALATTQPTPGNTDNNTILYAAIAVGVIFLLKK